MFSLLLLIIGLAQVSGACTWQRPVQIGVLPAEVNESSGMAISRRIANRTYRINDSGDSGRFFALGIDGSNSRSVSVTGFQPRDAEDIAVGPCGTSDCIFIGDIGDNARMRPNLEIAVVEEREQFPAAVAPRYQLKLRYPDRARDAEAMAVHPDGTIYILTKDPTAPEIYRLTARQWQNAGATVQTLERVLSLDLAKLLPVSTVFDRLPTSMDISPDGRRVLILTYRNAVELLLDLSASIPPQASWQPGVHYRQVDLTVLEQQEAIAYLPDGNNFLYDTEKSPNAKAARIMRVACTK